MTGRVVEANGVRHHVEEAGSGDTVVLLHGGLGSSETFAAQVPALAERFRVVAFDRRGHGRTPDVEGPFGYDAMLDDTVALLSALRIGRARIVGFSDGAILGLLMAVRRPELVERLVAIGGNAWPDGMEPWFTTWLARAEAETYPQAYVDAYGRLSPDGPSHWPVVFAKTKRMWLEEPSISEAELAGIEAPTLVMAGDRDLVSPEHSVVLYRTLPNARLAIVPGATHDVHEERPEVVNRLLVDFLTA